MSKKVLRAACIGGIGLLFATVIAVARMAQAQAPGGIAYAKVSAVAEPSSLKPGGRGTVLVTIEVSPGFHINSVKPADSTLWATKLTMSKVAGFSYGRVTYPANQTVRESYSPKPLLVYEGKAVIRVPVTVASSLKPGHYTLNGTLTYQGCNHTACFPPKTPAIHVPITVE